MVPQISVRKSDTTVDENGTVTKGHVSFELKVAVEYGSNIPEVVENLRQAIVKEVAALTDFYVDSVDVVVARLVNIQKEAAPLVTEQEKAAVPEAEKNPLQHKNKNGSPSDCMSSDGDFLCIDHFVPCPIGLSLLFKGDSSLFDGRLGCPMASAGNFRSEYLEKKNSP